MNCDFIKNLNPEQLAELRKLLDEAEQTKEVPQYRVEVDFWDKEKTLIKSLKEYQGNAFHGVCKGWYKNGLLHYEYPYQNGLMHGTYKCWYENGQLSFEQHYQNGHPCGGWKSWDENGQCKNRF